MRLPGLMAVLLPAALTAQAPEGPGLVRGILLECEEHGGAGAFSVRTASHEVFRFSFDAKTYLERDKERIEARRLVSGELVEVVADRGRGMRYARTVHVVEPPRPARPPLLPGMVRTYRSPLEHMVPTGNLTFSGVLSRVNGERVVLRGRDGADRTILLRGDTRFLDGGEIVELGNLRPNMRVFIRAGKDLYGEVEAFQIIRGGILQPEPR
jgi:hypothetical protein